MFHRWGWEGRSSQWPEHIYTCPGTRTLCRRTWRSEGLRKPRTPQRTCSLYIQALPACIYWKWIQLNQL